MNNTTYDYIQTCSFFDSVSFIILEFPSRKYFNNQIAVCVANSVLVIPTILLNGISVLTITRSSQLKERLCYFLILLQAVVDLAVGAISLPLETFLRAREVLGSAKCVTNFVLSMIALVPFGLTLTTTCAITFERYMGILHPIIHLTYLTKKRFLIYTCSTGVLLMVIVPLAVASKKAYNILGVAYLCIPLAFNAFAYTKIYLAGRNSDTAFTDSSVKHSSSEFAKKKQFLRELKLGKSCALVVVTFYLCFLQAPILNVIFINAEPAEFRAAQSWAATVCALNSSLNSLIFFWQSPLLRKQAFNICSSIGRH